MPKTKGTDYFALMEEMAAIACRAAEKLRGILSNFHLERLDDDMRQLHAIEHEGDECKHALVSNLVREFITPIEREDILSITDRIDDVTDAVEDVLLKIYMFNVTHIREDAAAFAELVTKCCDELLSVFREFPRFKKSKALHEAIVRMNQLEEQGDALYIGAVRALHTSQADAREVAAWTEIYHCLEVVCDACEHAADLVEHVVMKNS